MHSRNQRALAIVAVAGLAGAAWGQVISVYSDGAEGVNLFQTIGGGHEVHIVGGSVAESCVIAGGFAVAEAFAQGRVPTSCHMPCDPEGGIDPLSWSECVTSPTAEPSDSASIVCSEGCLIGAPYLDLERGGAEATATLSLGAGSWEVELVHASAEEKWGMDNHGQCVCYDHTKQREIGNAVIATAYTHDIFASSSVTISVEHTFHFGFGGASDSQSGGGWGDCPYPLGLTGPSTQPMVFMVIIKTEATGSVSSASGAMHWGILTTYPDETFDYVGMFDDPSFDLGSGSDNLDLESEFVGTIDSVSVNTQVETLALEDLLSGDVDGDGEVCGDDRVAFMAAYNSSIGDANYNIRADFNLDGVVDADDLAHLNSIGCTADLDCDGALTIFDQTAFSNAFGASDPVADWDGDGSFTIFDFTEFANTFALGCP